MDDLSLPPQPPTSRRRGRVVLGAVLAAAVLGGAVTTWAVTRDDDTDQAVTTEVAGPAAAAQAKARRMALIEGQGAADSAGAATSVAADAPMAEGLTMDCIGDDWQPSPEDVAAANADTDALAATFDRYGIAYTVTEDDFGFRNLEYDYSDAIAESVSASFWADRYPPEPIPAEELDRIRAENDGLAARFDDAGITYTRMSDDAGWEWLEWDYENRDAQTIADAYYTELYPPEPIPAEELDRIRAENDGLAARFDDAGITYTRMSDDAGWEWLEWDYENPDAQTIADAYYTELYPPIDCGGMPMPVDPGIGGEVPVAADPAPADPVTVEPEAGSDEPVALEDTPDVAPSIEELPAEERERMLAEVQGLAAAFDAAGIEYTEVTDEFGYGYLEWDYEDPAAQEVADAFYTEFFAPDPAVVAARQARVAALTAAFDAAGVTYTVEGEADWAYVLFPIDDPNAPAAVAAALAR